MWRRLYLVLLAIRLYFALRPSYIHPDEHFQGPEVIAGEVFGWPSHPTWEFEDDHPIRSIFPLQLVYGFPLTILKWIWEGLGYGDVQPMLAFYTLRLLMFILSFVLEDWALHELLPVRRERTVAIALVASSYVTWTFQTHTFSNSIETLLVLWCMVLIGRIRANRESTMAKSCIGLAFLGVLGIFNRITFPAFLIIPAAQLIPHLFVRRLRVPLLLAIGVLTLAVGITIDTEFYKGVRPRFRQIYTISVFTPWNNLRHNLQPSNLAQHGLHPYYQHIAINLPQLLGPAFPLLLLSSHKTILFWSAITGTILLSCIQHQEPRFLLPAIPLLLSSIRIPRKLTRLWLTTWLLFNALGGTIFGIYHQGGVVPAQAFLSRQTNIRQVFWWKTYSPPTWLLNGNNQRIRTTDLMGMPGDRLFGKLYNGGKCEDEPVRPRQLLVAPASATFLDRYTAPPEREVTIHLRELWRYDRHIGLDDLDFGEEGVWGTLRRVVGRRGLVVYEIEKIC